MDDKTPIRLVIPPELAAGMGVPATEEEKRAILGAVAEHAGKRGFNGLKEFIEDAIEEGDNDE